MNNENAWSFIKYDRIQELEPVITSSIVANSIDYSETGHVQSLLMCAAAHGAVKCAEYLIEKGADVNLRNYAGYTALHWAAHYGREETVDLLIRRGAKLESRTADGMTALHVASVRGHVDFAVFLLNSYKPDINAVSSNGWSSIFYAIAANHKDVVKVLVEYGADCDSPDDEGRSIFDLANEYGRSWIKSIFP